MPTFFVYLVHTGDTLTSIARQFRTTARSVAYWNRATYPSLDPESAAYRPDAIKVGWRLQMQPGVTLDEEEVPSLPPGPQPSTEPSAG